MHLIAGFTCGDPAIDAFLATQALSEQQMGLSSTTVAVHSMQNDAVVGFFSMSPIHINLDTRVLIALDIPPDIIRYPRVGGYLLGRLGTSAEHQKQNIGSSLVAVAVEHARRSRAETGGVFLAVDPKTDGLVEWYGKLGFQRVGAGKRMLLKL